MVTKRQHVEMHAGDVFFVPSYCLEGWVIGSRRSDRPEYQLMFLSTIVEGDLSRGSYNTHLFAEMCTLQALTLNDYGVETIIKNAISLRVRE